DSNHSLHLHLLKSNQVILKKPSQRWFSTLTHSWMKLEQISRTKKLPFEIWKFKLDKLLNNSIKVLKNHPTFFLVIQSSILDKSARRLHLGVGKQKKMTLKIKNQLKILVPHLPKRKKKCIFHL
ncbi:hypothetical protein PIB30_112822, partial [Stylosanthes scabra]|nr:hypothetical protein [Stylosanthes scabra]